MPLVSFKELSELKSNFSAKQLQTLDIPNKNILLIKDLLDRKLKFSDNGNEVGSRNYINSSTHFFVRAKALQNEYFIPNITEESSVPIRPQVFIDYKLKEGDLLLSKDSNIGEAVILDKDYPNHTISGALYRLPITKHKYYLFAFLKHKYFLEQLDLLVPKGSTIRHAKTLFLDCKIPFPNQANSNEVVEYVEKLTQAIINKEKEIRNKNQQIFELIEKELVENQQSNQFVYREPSFRDLEEVKRLDSGLYGKKFKQLMFLITNYQNGYYFLNNNDLKSGSTPKEKKRIFNTGKIKWITPTILTKFGILKKTEFISIKNNRHNIKKDCLLIVNRGNKEDLLKAFFYDFNNLDIGQHNQGLYRLEQDKNYLLHFCCLLNSQIYRKLVSYYSLGSKMPEIKIEQISKIPFPKFPENKQLEIASLYHKPTAKPQNLTLENFLESDSQWNKEAGILELDESAKQYKEFLNKVLDDIVNDKIININFK